MLSAMDGGGNSAGPVVVFFPLQETANNAIAINTVFWFNGVNDY
jgi:hypothetical protein